MQKEIIFKQEPYNKGKLLEGLFNYQRSLMTQYRDRGLLMPYPIDLNSRESQKELKEYLACIIEELAEADAYYEREIYLPWYDNQHKLVPEFHGFDKAFKAKLQHNLIEYNEELADVLHFVLEVMVFANIGNDDIVDYYQTLLVSRQLSNIYFEEGIQVSFAYASYQNIFEQESYREVTNMSFKLYDDSKGLGGRFLSSNMLSYTRLYLWEVTRYFNLARNKLKMRKWKQEDVKTNINEFQLNLMEGWVALFRLFHFIGLSKEQLYENYEAKNIKNQERILSKY